MVTNLFKKIFGSRNDRLVKRLSKSVTKVTDFEPELHGAQ